MFERGLKEMATAVELAPDSVGVPPPGAILLQASRGVPGAAGKSAAGAGDRRL